MQKHYIIGDIHAEYKTLLALVDKLPTDARLVFVGDLLSRGSQGKEVIAFVRENAFCCIRGNYEEYFLKFGSLFLEELKIKKRTVALFGLVNLSQVHYALMVYWKKSLHALDLIKRGLNR